MAWNQSKTSIVDNSKAFSFKAPLVLLVVLIIAVTGGIAFYLMSTDVATTDIKAAEVAKTKIKEVRHEKGHGKATLTPPSQWTREERLAWFEKKYGDNIPENLKTTVYFLKNPPAQTFKPLPRREDVFTHQSERTLASILLMKPGAFILQRSVYDEKFDHDFERSLKEPTLISADDPEDVRELKRAVNEAKADLAQKMKDGKKPSEVLNEVMENAYELSKFSANLEEMVREVSDDPSKTDQEVRDFVEAANKMLKDKGASEIAMPRLFHRQARLRVLAKKSAAKKTETKGSK